MKVIIEKFGPVKKFEYDLDKDMIVTYGNNNIGKSYAMQIVYLLLKTFIDNVLNQNLTLQDGKWIKKEGAIFVD